jgi:hypothetical protein
MSWETDRFPKTVIIVNVYSDDVSAPSNYSQAKFVLAPSDVYQC